MVTVYNGNKSSGCVVGCTVYNVSLCPKFKLFICLFFLVLANFLYRETNHLKWWIVGVRLMATDQIKKELFI